MCKETHCTCASSPCIFFFCFSLSNDSYSCNQQILAWKVLIGVPLIAIINEILVKYWKSKVKGENYYHFEKIYLMVKNSQKAKKTSVTSERVPISSKPSNLDCRDSGESFDAHIVAVCKIFEKGRGFCRAPCLAVGLLYTCILQGARQAQGPCCTNPTRAKFWVSAANFFLSFLLQIQQTH